MGLFSLILEGTVWFMCVCGGDMATGEAVLLRKICCLVQKRGIFVPLSKLIRLGFQPLWIFNLIPFKR